jgi:hypothetical protein
MREPEAKHRQLLAQRGGRGGLAVRARQHGHLRRVHGHLGEMHDNLVHRRQQHVLQRALQHQAVREVVDVLGRARKVEHLGQRRQRGRLARALLQVILHGLDVVVRGLFNLLHALRVLQGELRDQVVQRSLGLGRELRELLENPVIGRSGGAGRSSARGAGGELGRAAQQLHPLDLNLDALLDQGVFGEVVAERARRLAIPPVHRGHGSERGERERLWLRFPRPRRRGRGRRRLGGSGRGGRRRGGSRRGGKRANGGRRAARHRESSREVAAGCALHVAQVCSSSK